MMYKIYIQILFFLILTCSQSIKSQNYAVQSDSLNVFDSQRNRKIPITIYLPKTDKKINNQQIVIFSHGYYQNRPHSNVKYSYLTNFLASKGYFVVSIQHELPTDSLIPSSGIPQVVRRPFWERGAKNIFFVINELKKTNPKLDFKHITLIGHSNGGDMTALFHRNIQILSVK